MPQQSDPHSGGVTPQDILTLPFAGLGLDLVQARHKVLGLWLSELPHRQAPLVLVRPKSPPVCFGYGLLVRLCRETLGS